jgi:hypothetical protein
VADELVGHEAAGESFGSERKREAWDRLHSTALLLIVAIDQVLSFERRVRRLTGDAELQRARARFDPPVSEPYVETFIHWSDGGGTIIDRTARLSHYPWIASPASSIATNFASRRARVSGFFASWRR